MKILKKLVLWVIAHVLMAKKLIFWIIICALVTIIVLLIVNPIIIAVMFSIVLIYLATSVKILQPYETGCKLFLGRPWKDVNENKKTNLVFVPFLIFRFITFSKKHQGTNIYPQRVMIAGSDDPETSKESQPITFDGLVVWYINKATKTVSTLGEEIGKIQKNLFGEKKVLKIKDGTGVEIEKEYWIGGIVGDLFASIAREFVAKNIHTLDAAYEIGDNFTEQMLEQLKKDMPDDTYGIRWVKVVAGDVKGSEQIETARENKAAESIKADQAKIEAEKEVTIAKGQAKAKRETGQADADVIFFNLDAKLKSLKKIQRIKSAKDAGQLLTLLLFGDQITSSVGDLKLFLAPNLENLFNSALKSQKSLGPKELVEAFMSLDPKIQKKIKTELTGGKK